MNGFLKKPVKSNAFKMQAWIKDNWQSCVYEPPIDAEVQDVSEVIIKFSERSPVILNDDWIKNIRNR